MTYAPFSYLAEGSLGPETPILCMFMRCIGLCPIEKSQDVQKKYRAGHRGKIKTKTACDGTSTTMKKEITETTPLRVEQVPPILYRIERKAKVWKVIHAIFPDAERSPEESDQRVYLTEFLSAIATLYLTAVNRGGSAFILKGHTMLPISLSTQNRSICVYGPYPSTEMSPVLLRSLGK